MFTEFDIPISERIQKLKAKRERINRTCAELSAIVSSPTTIGTTKTSTRC